MQHACHHLGNGQFALYCVDACDQLCDRLRESDQLRIGAVFGFDCGDQLAPMFTWQAEIGTEVEQGALSHFFRFWSGF